MHCSTPFHQRCVFIRANIRDLLPLTYCPSNQLLKNPRTKKVLEKSTEGDYLIGMTCGINFLIDFEGSQECFCGLCFTIVSQSDLIEHFSSEYHIDRLMHYEQPEPSELLNTEFLSRNEMQKVLEYCLEKMPEFNVDDPAIKYRHSAKEMPTLLKSISLPEQRSVILREPNSIKVDMGNGQTAIYCEECVEYVFGSDDEWSTHIFDQPHYEKASRRLVLSRDQKNMLPALTPLSNFVRSDTPRWSEHISSSHGIIVLQDACEYGLQFIVNDRMKKIMICLCCHMQFDDRDIVALHVRSLPHITRSLHHLSKKPLVLAPQESILEYLTNLNQPISHSLTFLYDPVLIRRLEKLPKVSSHLLILSEIDPAKRMEYINTIKQREDPVGSEEFVSIPDLLRISLITLDEQPEDQFLFQCKHCQQTFSATFEHFTKYVTEHLLCESHYHRTQFFRNNPLDESKRVPKKYSRVEVQPYYQNEKKKLLWKWSDRRSTYEFLFAQVGLKDIWERRNSKDSQKADLLCTLCAQSFKTDKLELFDHITSFAHVFCFVNKYYLENVGEIQALLLKSEVSSATKQKQLRRLFAQLLKEHERKRDRIPIYDFDEEESEIPEVKLTLAQDRKEAEEQILNDKKNFDELEKYFFKKISELNDSAKVDKDQNQVPKRSQLVEELTKEVMNNLDEQCGTATFERIKTKVINVAQFDALKEYEGGETTNEKSPNQEKSPEDNRGHGKNFYHPNKHRHINPRMLRPNNPGRPGFRPRTGWQTQTYMVNPGYPLIYAASKNPKQFNKEKEKREKKGESSSNKKDKDVRSDSSHKRKDSLDSSSKKDESKKKDKDNHDRERSRPPSVASSSRRQESLPQKYQSKTEQKRVSEKKYSKEKEKISERKKEKADKRRSKKDHHHHQRSKKSRRESSSSSSSSSTATLSDFSDTERIEKHKHKIPEKPQQISHEKATPSQKITINAPKILNVADTAPPRPRLVEVRNDRLHVNIRNSPAVQKANNHVRSESSVLPVFPVSPTENVDEFSDAYRDSRLSESQQRILINPPGLAIPNPSFISDPQIRSAASNVLTATATASRSAASNVLTAAATATASYNAIRPNTPTQLQFQPAGGAPTISPQRLPLQHQQSQFYPTPISTASFDGITSTQFSLSSQLNPTTSQMQFHQPGLVPQLQQHLLPSQIPPSNVQSVPLTREEMIMKAKADLYGRDLMKLSNVSEFIEYVWNQGSEQISPDEKLLFNEVVRKLKGVIGVNTLYQIICYQHPELETYYCGMCNHWMSVSEAFHHLVSSRHRLCYLYKYYKLYYQKAINELNEAKRDEILRKYAMDIWNIEHKTSGKCVNRMKCIINLEIIERIRPDYQDSIDHSWKLMENEDFEAMIASKELLKGGNEPIQQQNKPVTMEEDRNIMHDIKRQIAAQEDIDRRERIISTQESRSDMKHSDKKRSRSRSRDRDLRHRRSRSRSRSKSRSHRDRGDSPKERSSKDSNRSEKKNGDGDGYLRRLARELDSSSKQQQSPQKETTYLIKAAKPAAADSSALLKTPTQQPQAHPSPSSTGSDSSVTETRRIIGSVCILQQEFDKGTLTSRKFFDICADMGLSPQFVRQNSTLREYANTFRLDLGLQPQQQQQQQDISSASGLNLKSMLSSKTLEFLKSANVGGSGVRSPTTGLPSTSFNAQQQIGSGNIPASGSYHAQQQYGGTTTGNSNIPPLSMYRPQPMAPNTSAQQWTQQPQSPGADEDWNSLSQFGAMLVGGNYNFPPTPEKKSSGK